MTSIPSNDAGTGDEDTWRLPRLDEVDADSVPTHIDTSIPHTARIYDYLLGGKSNFAVDRAAAEHILGAIPDLATTLRLNRLFLQRSVRYAARRGIRQFLDVGTGIPAAGNTHEAAHEIAPDARVAYVDNDPIVLVHGRALMTDHGPGQTTFTQADLRDPKAILTAPEVLKVIDFAEPIALMLVAILHFIKDEENPGEIVATLRDALPPGSMLILSHASYDSDPARGQAGAAGWKNASAEMTMRSYDRVLAFFEGFELIEPPGIRPHWNPDGEPETPLDAVENVWGYGGVGIKR
ncbi:SAM-dependent methyltransferase [Embleya sp. NBC_00896]|uniref:SAM-dependent methyltransferase n=1 Tax=Embleya sp. NBC_00896 TaxID=2975961 RepID=UPI002F90BE45|nr:SAM-dependent methyltransferase [Embleya sp. NBC_00896]